MRNIKSALTNNGKEMLANIEGKNITFTKAVVGQYKSKYPLEQLNNVEGYLKDMIITGSRTEDNRFILYLTLNNRDVTNDTYIYQIGIFAKVDDGEEKLVQIIEADVGDFIPNQTELFEKEYETSIKFESSFCDATININYGSCATLISRHNNDENAHPKLKEWVKQQIENTQNLEVVYATIDDINSLF